MTIFKSREEAKNHWEHKRGYNFDFNRCAQGVQESGRSFGFHQCSRKPGHGPDGIYCKQHAPANSDVKFFYVYKVMRDWDSKYRIEKKKAIKTTEKQVTLVDEKTGRTKRENKISYSYDYPHWYLETFELASQHAIRLSKEAKEKFERGVQKVTDNILELENLKEEDL